MSNSQLNLIFQILSLGLCVLLAYLARIKSHRLRTLVPEWALRLIYLFLVIQILLLVINVALEHTGANLFPRNLWHLDRERNIPSIVSTIQLLLLGILCLATGITSVKISWAERLYWLVLCLGITIIALVEFELLPRGWFEPSNPAMYILSILSGLLVAAATLSMILRNSDGKRRLYLSLLLGGLGVWGLGALVVDNIHLNNTTKVTVSLEETLETLGILVALAGVAGYMTRIVPQTLFRRKMLLISLCLTSAIIVVLLLGFSVWEDREYVGIRFLGKHFGRKITVDIDDGALALRGWSSGSLSAGTIPRVHLWLHTTRLLKNDIGFTIQLLDQESKAVIEETNKRSDRKADQWEPGIRHYFTQKILFALPEDIPANRALWLLLSFWKIEGDGFGLLPVGFSDHPLLGDTHVILDELVLPEPVKSTSHENAPARFANGFVLQAASIPGRAQAGEELQVTFRWGTDSAGSEDWTQFLHLDHEESGLFWNVDQMPLGLRLPTRLWYAGLQASEVWQFTLPADLQPGRYAIYSGLYRPSDLQRLAVTLADGTQPADARIPLGTIHIEG